MKYILIFLIMSFYYSSTASELKDRKIDSLLTVLNSTSEELSRYELMEELGTIYLNVDNEKCYEYSIQAYDYAIKENNNELRKKSSYTLAYYFNGTGEYSKAITYFIESDDLSRQMEDTLGMILCENGLGNLHLGDNNFELALEHYTLANDLSREVNDTSHIGITYIGMGNAIAKLGDDETALIYFEKSILIYPKEKNLLVYASILANMAESQSKLGNEDKALSNNFESLDIMIELNHGYGIAVINQNIGAIYKKQYKNTDALNYYLKSAKKHKEIGALDDLQVCYLAIGEVYEELGEKGSAYDYLKLHLIIKDSLFNEKNTEIIAEMQNKYDQELNNNEIILLNKENEINEERLKVKESEQFYLYGGLSLTLVFLGFILNRYRIIQKQKEIISNTNNTLNYKNKELSIQRDEILASITYAKRIQNAILPQDKVIKKLLKESFVLYKPKDIVAGDFYWLEERDNKVLFAAADCTGHGVPGAMVSVICNNALNRSVREHGLTDPGQILDRSREIVIEEFEKSDEEVKDGMDIALCSLEGNKLQYAGGHNPLWIVRDGEILETKADKQPIGKFEKQEPYTTHTFELEKGDSIYIFSDGYIDQFGGVKGKKFKIRAFRELLLSIQKDSMTQQKKKLDDAFIKWRGAVEQLDDVCIIGVRY